MLVTASPAPTVSYCLTSESVQVGRAREQARNTLPGWGLELIDGLIEPYGGTRGVVDDGDCLGKTVYVAVSLAPDPEGIQ
jgi:hypothetical protein